MRSLPMILTVASVSLASLAASAAFAADLPSAPRPVAPPVLDNGWRFQATIYGWATSLNGDIGVRGLPPADVDVTFGDILKNLDGALMGSFYASNGTWSVLTDLVWAKLSDDVTVGPFGGTVGFEQTQAILSGIVGYRLPIGPPQLDLSATAGFRYNHINAQVDVSPALVPITVSREGTQDWVDPTIGLSAHYDINDRWFINALADIGGFGVGSKFTTQGFATVGYRWTKTLSSALGYRAIYTDYENGGFVYKTTEHGLFTSLGIRF